MVKLDVWGTATKTPAQINLRHIKVVFHLGKNYFQGLYRAGFFCRGKKNLIIWTGAQKQLNLLLTFPFEVGLNLVLCRLKHRLLNNNVSGAQSSNAFSLEIAFCLF